MNACSYCGAQDSSHHRACPCCGTPFVADDGQSNSPNPYEPPVSAPGRQATADGLPWLLQRFALIIAVALGSLLYRVLVHHSLEQTAALFVGLPALVAAAVSLIPKCQSPIGVALWSTTYLLCLAGVLLGEGFICIVMSAPIFLLMALLVSLPFHFAKKRNSAEDKVRFHSWIPLLLLAPVALSSMEGTSDRIAFRRREYLEKSKWVAAPAARIIQRLHEPIDISSPLPAMLTWGFPVPDTSTGSGLKVGDERNIHFHGGEGHPGTLTLRVTASTPGRIQFECAQDTSHISHWLHWKTMDVSWMAEAEGTRLSIAVEYDRMLDPAWYFGPLERRFIGEALEYHLEALGNEENWTPQPLPPLE